MGNAETETAKQAGITASKRIVLNILCAMISVAILVIFLFGIGKIAELLIPLPVMTAAIWLCLLLRFAVSKKEYKNTDSNI